MIGSIDSPVNIGTGSDSPAGLVAVGTTALVAVVVSTIGAAAAAAVAVIFPVVVDVVWNGGGNARAEYICCGVGRYAME